MNLSQTQAPCSPAFISTTRIKAAYKDAMINASSFLLSHRVLHQLGNTKGPNKNCKESEENLRLHLQLHGDEVIINDAL